VRTLRPGEVLEFDLSTGEPRLISRLTTPIAPGDSSDVPAAVEDSVARHLRSDVPISCLLSGGLDSSIIGAAARRHTPELHTYCSGAPDASPIAGVPQSEDFAFARRVASHLGTSHTEVPVSRELFAQRWPWMVEALGLPLSTPNEVAIHEVSRRIRADGRIVALSGEGADELFGGYDQALGDVGPADTAARRLLDSASWMPIDAKPAILNGDLWKGLEGDSALIAWYADEFEACAAGADPAEPLQAHLRFQRRINLAGLLARLDTATMLAGVEGRTPFADASIAALAESLPMARKFQPGPPARTKIALRQAFASELPPEVVGRPKASFPLPFQEWMEDHAGVLRGSAFAREVFTEAAIATVTARPRELWRLAWPMINLAMWGRRWWG
jgi:asparagine synthase (glutamine-hydrolysing)